MGEMEIRESLGELRASIREMSSRLDRHESVVRDTNKAVDVTNTLLFEKIERIQNILSESRGTYKGMSVLAHFVTFITALAAGHYWK